MHELSIALNIIDIASAEAERHGGGLVNAIHIKMGPLSGVVKEALVSAYELACEQSPLAASRLVVEEVPIIVYCEQCDAQQPVASIQSLVCAVCSTPTGNIVSGQDLEVTALEMEV
jgi:hydrogenase nickel incorporation protein HypA/HybF